MTYKEASYQCVLDIQLLTEATKADIRAYRAKQKAMRLCHASTKDLSEIDITINVYQKFLDELENINSDLMDQMSIISEQLNDEELNFFILRYGKGAQMKDIMASMYISKSKYYKIQSSLAEKLESTESGRNFKNILG